jgi:hypothetical protein
VDTDGLIPDALDDVESETSGRMKKPIPRSNLTLAGSFRAR